MQSSYLACDSIHATTHFFPPPPDAALQREWIRECKKDEALGKQFYFIIERKDGSPCGTVRIYDIQDNSFCWGSWILNGKKPRYAALESAFLVYDFGFNHLDFTRSHFDVMKNNNGVINFHTRMGAIKTHEDEDNQYFEISRTEVNRAKKILSRKIK